MSYVGSKSLEYSLVAAALLAATCGPAAAVDGVVLIDQNKALAGNVTPGDGPGFPVTITAPGSYRLSSNLVVPDANTSAIVIAPSTVGATIDLNGFSIIGPSVCSGFPLSCAPTGAGIGVSTDGSDRGTRVYNGTVVGMGSVGLQLIGAASSIENVNVVSNGQGGIVISLGSATANRVSKNGGIGIAGGNSVITQNNVVQNRSAGISVNDSIIINNALIVNGSVGVSASNSGFASNVFSSNNGSFANPQFSGNRAIGSNLCDGSVCP